MRLKLLLFIVVALLILTVCVKRNVEPPPVPIEKIEEGKQVIKMEIIDQIIYYEGQSFWAEEEFAKLSKDDLIVEFQEKYKVEAREFEVSFDEANYSTIIKCQVYGCVYKSAERYIADFLWFLNPLSLDFIDDNFEESTHGLSWKGNVDGVPTIIQVECPPQGSIYKAWQHPVGHCHGHIWWPVP